MDNKCLSKIKLLGKEIRVDKSYIEDIKDIFVIIYKISLCL